MGDFVTAITTSNLLGILQCVFWSSAGVLWWFHTFSLFSGSRYLMCGQSLWPNFEKQPCGWFWDNTNMKKLCLLHSKKNLCNQSSCFEITDNFCYKKANNMHQSTLCCQQRWMEDASMPKKTLLRLKWCQMAKNQVHSLNHCWVMLDWRYGQSVINTKFL